MKCQDLTGMFEKIEGYKKFVYCKHCGKRVQVQNYNQTICDKCGHNKYKK